MDSKVEKFKELQPIAEKFYFECRYEKAKEVYETILTLCRKGTDKYECVLSCIKDMESYLK